MTVLVMLSVVEGFPRHFGHFLLLTSFGRGGMGEVYLGKQRVGDAFRLCVVKTLRGDLADHQEYVRRFLDEARVVVQLSHAHISQVYEAGVVGTDHFLAMEFIHGLNLRDVLTDLTQRQQRADPGLAVHVVSTTLDALGYAHRLESPTTGAPLRVVHRDVSPANVMVSFEGEVKLIDFGLAESALKTEETESRLVMGKVAYMAPEQARGDDVDGACDQFACGVMLYEAVTGDRFYGDMNTHQIWQIVGHGGYVPKHWASVPEKLRPVLARSLDKDRSKRFPSCDAFRDALDDVRAELWPRAGKGQLRELLTSLYGVRVAHERALISSFASLAPPGEEGDPRTEPSVPGLVMGGRELSAPSGLSSLPSGRAANSLPSGRAVHSNSSPFGGPSHPGFAASSPSPASALGLAPPTAPPPPELTASVLRGNVELREGFTNPRASLIDTGNTMSAHQPAAPAPSRVGGFAAAAAAVVVLSVGIVVVGTRRTATPIPAVDAGMVVVVPAPAPVAVAVVVDAGATVVAAATPIPPPAALPAPLPAPAKIVPVRPRPGTEKAALPAPRVLPTAAVAVAPVVVPAAPATPPPSPAPVPVPAPPPTEQRSFAEDLATLRSCPLEGAKKARGLVDAMPPEKQKASEALIHFWASKCRGH